MCSSDLVFFNICSARTFVALPNTNTYKANTQDTTQYNNIAMVQPRDQKLSSLWILVGGKMIQGGGWRPGSGLYPLRNRSDTFNYSPFVCVCVCVGGGNGFSPNEVLV